MSIHLKRRLSKIEKILAPVPALDIRIVVEPDEDADAEAHEEHRLELEAALQDADHVFLVSSQNLDCHPESRKLRLFVSEALAIVTALAMRPSAQGGKSCLDDVLASLTGKVIEPVEDAICPSIKRWWK